MKLGVVVSFFQVQSRRSTPSDGLIYFNLYQSPVFTLDSMKYNRKEWK